MVEARAPTQTADNQTSRMVNRVEKKQTKKSLKSSR